MGTPGEQPQGLRDELAARRRPRRSRPSCCSIHGSADDNVHLANTLAFVAALVKAGRPYALQLHPRQLHGFRPKEDRIARDRALLAHFERTLEPEDAPGLQAAVSLGARRRLSPSAFVRRPPRSGREAAHVPGRQLLETTATCPAFGRHASASALPGGVRSVISSASASSTAARSSGSSSSLPHKRRERAAEPLVLVPGQADHGREQRHLAVREAGEVGREHQVGHVLVAVEEVDGAPDVQDPRRLPQRLAPSRPRASARAPRRAPRRTPRAARAVLGPAHEARRQRVDRPPPHRFRGVERLARHAERQPLPHALAGDHDRRRPRAPPSGSRSRSRRPPPSRAGPRSAPAPARASSGARPRAQAAISCRRRRASS